MHLFEIKTVKLSQYLKKSNTSQPLKYFASELDCANCDLVCYQSTTILIATVLENCVFRVNAIENEEQRVLVARLSPVYCHSGETSERYVSKRSRGFTGNCYFLGKLNKIVICFDWPSLLSVRLGEEKSSRGQTSFPIACLSVTCPFLFFRVMCICTDFKLYFNLYYGLWQICN